MLQPLTDNVWTVDHDLFTMGIHFPGRMTVVRLSDGGLWLHSPVPIDDALAAQLAELGPVRHLVGPNLFHHVHLRGVKARYPEAQLWAGPGLTKKRADLSFDHLLNPEAAKVWGPELELIDFSCAPRIGESLFFHAPSRTLIVTDLLMNVHACQGLMSRLVYWLEGVYRRLAVPRLNQWLVKDPAEASRVAGRLIALAPDRLVMAHGELVTDQTTRRLTEALSVFKPTPAIPEPAEAS